MSSTPATSKPAPVLDIIPETSDTQTFRLGTYFPYKAGQSISLLIPGDPNKRYYSMSSSPTEKGHIDVTIKAERDQVLYGSVFGLRKESLVEIAGPLGNFSLPEKLQGPYYFLAGGTGVTPFRSMIKYILDTTPTIETWLFHSVRTPEDLIFKEQFLAWSQNAAFHYVPTFTRWTDSDLKATTGRIGEGLLRKHLPLIQGTFYLCGSKEFVGDMERVLIGLEVPARHIRREQWK